MTLRLQAEALALRRAVALGDAVERELRDRGASGQAAHLEAAADVAHDRLAGRLDQVLAAALLDELERVALALALARDEDAHEPDRAPLGGLARQQRGRHLEGEAVERGPRVDAQAQAGARRRPPALRGEERAARDGLELEHDRLRALALALGGHHRLELVDADALEPRRRDRGLVGRLAADAQLAAVERVADLDALGLAVADLGRDEDRRELRRRAGRVGADADGADAAELEPAVLRVAGELLAARVGDEAAGHAAEVAEERIRAGRGGERVGHGPRAGGRRRVRGCRRGRGRRRRRRRCRVGSATGCTAAVGWASASAAATSFVAVTMTVIMWPTSASVSVYVSSVAPVMSSQLLPVKSQRCHW